MCFTAVDSIYILQNFTCVRHISITLYIFFVKCLLKNKTWIKLLPNVTFLSGNAGIETLQLSLFHFCWQYLQYSTCVRHISVTPDIFFVKCIFIIKLKLIFLAYVKHNRFFCVLGTSVVRYFHRFPSCETQKNTHKSYQVKFKQCSRKSQRGRKEGIFRNKKKKICVRHTAEYWFIGCSGAQNYNSATPHHFPSTTAGATVFHSRSKWKKPITHKK